MDDAQLVSAFRAGDERSYRELYARYGRLVFSVAYGVVGEQTQAEEAVQQTFVRAWENAERFEPGRSLPSWLSVIARNAAIDIWRRERRRRHEQLDGLEATPGSADSTETVWAMREALDQLDEQTRWLLRMLYHEGYSQQDVANALGVPVGTVKSRTHAARRRLADVLRTLDIDKPGGSTEGRTAPVTAPDVTEQEGGLGV